jgi:hypothetical protein
MLFIINFFLLQWFYIRLYSARNCKTGKLCGFGFITNVKPLTGWNHYYNSDHKFRKPFVYIER